MPNDTSTIAPGDTVAQHDQTGTVMVVNDTHALVMWDHDPGKPRTAALDQLRTATHR